MSKSEVIKISKFLSLVLRHQQDKIDLTLDASGWAEVDALLIACQRHGVTLDRATLDKVVAENDKQRFAFDETRQRIRASQGHSVSVELGYAPAEPPPLLYHGTVERFMPSIRRRGLVKGQRHHVHLSADAATAAKVGGRRGAAVILTIHSGEMRAARFEFLRSANGVWLTERVPPEYILMPSA